MPSSVTAAELTQQIDSVVGNMEALVRGLTPAQLQWKPHPDTWSIVECLDHLNRTATVYIKLMRVAFERERHNASLPPKTFRLGIAARQFAKMLEPPYRIRVKAPARVQPPGTSNPADVEAEFYRIRLELRSFLQEASHVDMSAIRFSSPFASVLKLNLAEAFLVMAAHDRRHLWQAQNVKESPDFPVATPVEVPGAIRRNG